MESASLDAPAKETRVRPIPATPNLPADNDDYHGGSRIVWRMQKDVSEAQREDHDEERGRHASDQIADELFCLHHAFQYSPVARPKP